MTGKEQEHITVELQIVETTKETNRSPTQHDS